MTHRNAIVRILAASPRQETGHERYPTSIVMLTALACGTGLAMTGDHVAVPFRGEWVPPRATCTSPLKLVIDANLVAPSTAPSVPSSASSSGASRAGGQGVEDVVLLATEAMGDGRFMITLDGRKKARSVLSVDLSNDKKPAARLPLGTAALKKCS